MLHINPLLLSWGICVQPSLCLILFKFGLIKQPVKAGF